MSILELSSIQKLNILRNYVQHKTTQIDTAKKQKAIAAMSDLIERKPLTSMGELDKTDWQKAAISLLDGINREMLDPVRVALRASDE